MSYDEDWAIESSTIGTKPRFTKDLHAIAMIESIVRGLSDESQGEVMRYVAHKLGIPRNPERSP